MKKNNLIAGLALVILLSAPALRAQILSRGDLFGPGAPPPMIGVELGFGQHLQTGTYQAICQCEFPSGAAGIGFLGGLLFELPVSYEWTFGLGLKFDFKGYVSTVDVVDQATIRYLPGDSVSSGSFPLQREGTIKETFFVIAPFARYEFFRNGLFVQAGPGIGLLVSSTFTHKRILTSSTIKLNNSDVITNVRFENGTREETLEDGKIPNASSTRISALLTAGWDIPIGDHAVFAPMATLDLPLTTVRPDASGSSGSSKWQIFSMYFSIGLKYKLE